MSQETEEIKAKVDLIDFIGSYIKLLPAGANYKARCPFHNEKTPSFMANKAKQIWKCFGCNEGGDIFTFLMKIEGLEFPEALKILAQRAGVQLSRSNPEAASKKNRLHDLTDLASRYWRQILLESSQAEKVREYLKKRNISDDSIEDFKIGYAAESWDDLIGFLTKKGFGIEEIFSAGLAVRKEKGSGFYDRFRNRLMFPILDLSGRTAGFGGRILFTEEGAKYINTPQTEIYNKSLILYGLCQARDAIRKKDSCILVEGYMDVIPLHQAGIKNAVAISGTALTLEQIRILKRYTNNLTIALDMDAAGRMAAERSIDLALTEEMNVKAIRLPHGKDPGECVAKSPADFKQAAAEAQPVMNYFFGETFGKYDSAQPENKKLVAKILLNKIIRLGNLIERDFWLKELASRLDVSETVLREITAKLLLSRKTEKARTPARADISEIEKEKMILSRFLVLIFLEPEILSKIADSVLAEYWANEEIAELYKNLIFYYTKNTGLFDLPAVDNFKNDLFDNLQKWFSGSQKAADLLNESFLASQEEMIEEREIRSELEQLVGALKNKYLNRRTAALNDKLEKAKLENDPDEEKIAQQLNEVIKQKN